LPLGLYPYLTRLRADWVKADHQATLIARPAESQCDSIIDTARDSKRKFEDQNHNAAQAKLPGAAGRDQASIAVP
jgi:hypothetical protein